MRYKVGDRVVVRSDLTADRVYYMDDGETHDVATASMVQLAGQIVTIKTVSGNKYTIEEFRCWWTDEMFDGLESEQAPLEMDSAAWSSFFSPYQTGV